MENAVVMKWMSRWGALAVGLVATACVPTWADEPTVEVRTPEPMVELAPDTLTLPVPITAGSSFGLLMSRHGIPEAAVREAALDLYNLALIRSDRELQVTWSDGQAMPTMVRYGVDEDHLLLVGREDDGWSARREEVVYTGALERIQLNLTPSLWQAGIDAGLRGEDLVRLAEVFEYEVDFNSELRAGASLLVVAEQMSAPKRRSKLGAIHAVRLTNDGKVREGYRWAQPGPGGREDVGYYHGDGSGMKRAFLRSPLGFMRVTSKFNPKRFHPVLKKRRPHNGVDFGASTGTPVRAVADGVVTIAGWGGGHGNWVKIRHDGGIETSYSHLSKISVRKGQRISQGSNIGKVGSTGLATGPHLHFQMWKNGRYVDPLKAALPMSRPLETKQKPAFLDAVAHWSAQLDSDGPVVARSE